MQISQKHSCFSTHISSLYNLPPRSIAAVVPAHEHVTVYTVKARVNQSRKVTWVSGENIYIDIVQ